MKNTKVSCLTWTVLFFVAAGASGWFVYRRLPTSAAAMFGGFAGGVILVVLLAWLIAIPKRIGEMLMIVRALLGSEPRDGKRVAIVGTLRGSGELRAPFSHERCVLYSYEIIDTARKAYEGFAMVPLSIEQGTARIRLLAKPDISLTPAQLPMSAQRFVETTTFTPATTDEKDLSHTDGHLRYDHSHAPAPANLGGSRIVEKILRTETNVCALGTYRADRHALVAPLTLRTGTSFGVGAAWRVVNAGLATAFCAAIAIVAFTVFCALLPNDAADEWWEIHLERFVDKQVRAPLVQAGMLDARGFRLQPVCSGCAKGSLEIDGQTIELQHTAYVGGRSVHISAKPDDRDGVTLHGRDRVVLTIGGKSADVPPSWLQPHDIETSLREDGDYAGRITVVAPHGGIRCRVTFRTRVDADAWLSSNLTASPAAP